MGRVFFISKPTRISKMLMNYRSADQEGRDLYERV